jgi:hypothetical protein
MKFWIDRTSESDNVVVATDAAILVGSCDETAYDSVEQQLSSQQSPIEVLGTDDLKTIPYQQIQRVTSRSTDKDVEVAYKARKEIEQEHLYFEEFEAKEQFVSWLDQALPGNLVKEEFEQSAIGASLSPMSSLLLSLVAGYLFINKFRWLTVAVAGLWALSSLFVLVTRASSPPTVTRWTIDGRFGRKMWSGMKAFASYAFVALVVVVGSDVVADSWGSRSLYEQMESENLDSASVQTYLDRGADINYRDEEGVTVLSFALNWNEDDIAIALVDAGADLSVRDGDDLTPIEHAVTYGANINVIRAMHRNGASLDFEIDGMSLLEYAREYEYEELEAFLMQADELQSSAR